MCVCVCVHNEERDAEGWGDVLILETNIRNLKILLEQINIISETKQFPNQHKL